jgi:hypothetical protein
VARFGPDSGRRPHADCQRDQQRGGANHKDRSHRTDDQDERPTAALSRADAGICAGWEVVLVDEHGVGVGVLVRNCAIGQSLLAGGAGGGNVEVSGSDCVGVYRAGAGVLGVGQRSG